MFCNVNLSNLENVLQRNLRTDRASECIFGISGDTNLETLIGQCQPWQHLCRFNICTGLHKKALDMSLNTYTYTSATIN